MDATPRPPGAGFTAPAPSCLCWFLFRVARYPPTRGVLGVLTLAPPFPPNRFLPKIKPELSEDTRDTSSANEDKPRVGLARVSVPASQKLLRKRRRRRWCWRPWRFWGLGSKTSLNPQSYLSVVSDWPQKKRMKRNFVLKVLKGRWELFLD